MRSDFTGVVVAAGRASRFARGPAKQFHDLCGRSMLERSVRAVSEQPAVAGVIVVLPADQLDGPRAAEARGWPGVQAVVPGGASRAASVRLGVQAAGPAEYLLVHDAARPLASVELIEAVMQATRRHGAAIPALAVVDTVKELDRHGSIRSTLDRSRLRLAQTPQGFRGDWLRSALTAAEKEGVELTDESSAVERAGHPVHVVAGDPANLKITSPRDLEQARRHLEGPAMGLRVGSSFDIHRRGTAPPLVLGGVRFDDQPGLIGHSDADVVLHAAMDAVLGAAVLGDIGAHFPPGDPRFAGAASTGLAARVATMVREGGFRIVNIDLTLMAERPRIRDRVETMREAIAASFGLTVDRVSLKATTLEGLGAVGREEGIACQAVALLERTDVAG